MSFFVQAQITRTNPNALMKAQCVDEGPTRLISLHLSTHPNLSPASLKNQTLIISPLSFLLTPQTLIISILLHKLQINPNQILTQILPLSSHKRPHLSLLPTHPSQNENKEQKWREDERKRRNEMHEDR